MTPFFFFPFFLRKYKEMHSLQVLKCSMYNINTLNFNSFFWFASKLRWISKQKLWKFFFNYLKILFFEKKNFLTSGSEPYCKSQARRNNHEIAPQPPREKLIIKSYRETSNFAWRQLITHQSVAARLIGTRLSY